MTRSLVQLSVLICVLGNVATAFVHPSRRWTIQSKDTRPIFHTDTLTRRNNILRSSLDDDPEALEDEEYTFAPTNERDAYVTEAEQAQQANEMVATMQQSIDLPSEISNSFLRYALSIIMGRAIPDARDGLKPVHRRILYAMDQLNLYSSSGHRKCARVVGEVLGKFHPHGDMAVYDALVRLAQDFSTNYPLIDGHGNFGSIDADPAAAMRYTECRLTKLAQVALLEDLPESTVDFVSNFDGNEVEPNVLPAKLPILLLNGSSGIAVGMATNVPPHNLREVMTACVALVKARQGKTDEITEKQLLKFIPGPDFPTGAAILGTEGAKQLYTTSNGGVKMRAITNVEHVTKGKTTRDVIVVTELPYQVNKAALLEKMAALVNEKKLEGISDLRDESDRDGIRVVIELKRDAVASVVLNNLYQKTPLQTTFSGNFLALMHNGNQQGDDVISSANLVPQRFTLRQALDCFLDFRFATLRRKAKHKLEKVTARAHIVDGLLLALERVDAVIDIVRSAKDQNDARDKVQETLGTSEKQTDSILKLQLGQLTRLNKGKLTLEKQELESDRKRLTNLLEVDNAVYDAMTEEFEDMSKRFGVDRKTRIEVEEEGEVDELELVENSRSVIVVTRGGYVKRMPLKTFESQGRGTRGKRSTSDSSDESEIAHCFTCNDHDTLLMITQQGIAYALRAYQVPIGSRTAKGQPIPSVLPVKSDDVITSILPITEFTKNEYIVLATEKGWIKKTSLSSFKAITARGLTIATLDENDRLNWCNRCTDQDDILIGSSLGMATRFTAKDLRATGRTSRGVKAMKLKSDDTLASMNVLQGDSEDSVFVITSSGYGKRVKTDEFRLTERGRLGVIAIKFKKGNEDDRVRTLLSVHDDDELLVITAKGIIVRQKISEIPTQGRAATGVLIQKVDDGDFISSVSIVPKVDEIV